MALLNSRKFQVMLVDIMVSILFLLIHRFMAPDDADFAWKLVLVIQPIFLMLAGGIAYEDGKSIAAGTHISQLVRGDHLAGDKVGQDSLDIENVYGDVISS